MKTALALTLFLIPLGGFAGNDRTADFYTERSDKYLDKNITVNCAMVQRKNPTAGVKNALFYAYTCQKGGGGGEWIYVMIPPEKAPAFVIKFGSDFQYDSSGLIRTKPLSGFLRQIGGKFVIEYDPSKGGGGLASSVDGQEVDARTSRLPARE